jgi:hypothetical protein
VEVVQLLRNKSLFIRALRLLNLDPVLVDTKREARVQLQEKKKEVTGSKRSRLQLQEKKKEVIATR